MTQERNGERKMITDANHPDICEVRRACCCRDMMVAILQWLPHVLEVNVVRGRER